MHLEYVGSKVKSGVSEDFEHTKFYWGPENNWTCEVPDHLATIILTNWGIDKFKPVFPQVNTEKVVEERTLVSEGEDVIGESKPDLSEPKEKPKKRGRKKKK